MTMYRVCDGEKGYWLIAGGDGFDEGMIDRIDDEGIVHVDGAPNHNVSGPFKRFSEALVSLGFPNGHFEITLDGADFLLRLGAVESEGE